MCFRSYTYEGCSSHYLDCYFLDHSPCPKIHFDVINHKGQTNFDEKRRQPLLSHSQYTSRPEWWSSTVGSAQPNIPDDTIMDYGSYRPESPGFHVLYTYFFRPRYEVRLEVHNRVEAFNYGQLPCAVMHVRRGDIVMHTNSGRGYIAVQEYVSAGKPFMDELGIRTILLLTDSQSAIDEALNCKQDFPNICDGIDFRYVEKKRWIAAEGGWENPFPSGNSRSELMVIQTEFALAQQCDLAIVGDSSFAERIYSHMCCNFPLQRRGYVPQRCICPPRIRLQQRGFGCENGNKLLCDDPNLKGGDITRPLDDPSNMKGARFSFTKDAFKNKTKVVIDTSFDQFTYADIDSPGTAERVHAAAVNAKKHICRNIDHGLARTRSYCNMK
jgi:hypothetical protein